MKNDTRTRAVMSVRHALLALLSEGPSSGAQLRAEFASATGEVRPPNASQVHAALQWLERDGLVESDGAGPNGSRKRFRITANGGRELAGWLRRPPDLAAAPHDELAAKIQLALRVSGTDVHEMVQVHRRYLMEQMQRWTRIKQGNAGHGLRASLAVDAELFRLDSLIRWLDAADGHLEPAARRDQHRTASATDDRIRISDADRDCASARLRDHYAEGRLTHEELDERVTAALEARTLGDLRRVMADLPESTPVPQQAWTPPLAGVSPLAGASPSAVSPPAAASRPALGLRALLILTLVTQVLLGVLLIAGGGRPFPAFLDVVLGLALIICPAALVAASPRWRQMRR